MKFLILTMILFLPPGFASRALGAPLWICENGGDSGLSSSAEAPAATAAFLQKRAEICQLIQEMRLSPYVSVDVPPLVWAPADTVKQSRPPTASGISGGSLIVGDVLAEATKRARKAAIAAAMQDAQTVDCAFSKLYEETDSYQQLDFAASRFRSVSPSLDALITHYDIQIQVIARRLVAMATVSASKDMFERFSFMIGAISENIPTVRTDDCDVAHSYWADAVSKSRGTLSAAINRGGRPVKTCTPNLMMIPFLPSGSSGVPEDIELAEYINGQFTSWLSDKYGSTLDEKGVRSMSKSGLTLFQSDWGSIKISCSAPLSSPSKVDCTQELKTPDQANGYRDYILGLLAELRKAREVKQTLILSIAERDVYASAGRIIIPSSVSCQVDAVDGPDAILRHRDDLDRKLSTEVQSISKWTMSRRERAEELGRAALEMIKRRYIDFARRIESVARTTEANRLKENQKKNRDEPQSILKNISD